MRVVVFLHSNLRSGANLVMLRHAVHLGAQLVFQHDWHGLDIGFVPGHAALRPMLLQDYLAAAPAPADIAVTNWWTCAYEIGDIPARRYAYYRHGDEAALYQTPIFDALIGLIEREPFAWAVVNPSLVTPLCRAGHTPLILPPGVDTHAFATAIPALPPRTGRLRVLVEGPVGSPIKRVQQTVAMLRDIDGVETVHIAADGSHADGADHALGAVPHAAMAGICAACDLIAKLSTLEAFPMPVLEQFAAGGTAIVTAFPGVEAVVADGQDGIVVDRDAPFGPAAAAVIRLRDDPDLLARLRRAGQHKAAGHDWSGIHTSFEQFLRDALASGPPPALDIGPRFRACLHATIALWAQSQA